MVVIKMKKTVNLINLKGEKIKFEIGGFFKLFQIMKIKRLLRSNEYFLAGEEDAKVAMELKLY